MWFGLINNSITKMVAGKVVDQINKSKKIAMLRLLDKQK